MIGPHHTSTRVDIAAWLQYYAFDSLGAVNFSQMLGFLESGTDVDGICHLDHEQMMYFAVVGTTPDTIFLIYTVDGRRLELIVSSGAKSLRSNEHGPS